MKILDCIQRNTQLLRGVSESPELDVEILLAHALNIDKGFLYAHAKDEVPNKARQTFDSLMQKRLAHTPVAYIIGEKEFFGRMFVVNPSVLIPRPETELIVEKALACINQIADQSPNRQIRVADIGTGSGCIAITIALEVAKQPFDGRIHLLASDTSAEALVVAQANRDHYGLQQQIDIIKSDLLESINKPLDIIVANLPYVSEEEYTLLKPDLAHEPRSALVSDQGGLSHYIKLLRQMSAKHESDQETTVALFEISSQQSQELINHVHELFPTAEIRMHKDLSGKDRCAEIVVSA